MDSNEIVKKLKMYGLKFATTREFPLLCLSVIGFSYGTLLKKEIGFCYKALGGLGCKDKFHTLFNEEYVAEETQKWLETNFDNLKEFIEKTKRICDDSIKKIKKDEKIIHVDPIKYLSRIVESYVKYMVSLGMINCFWRYLGNSASKGKISQNYAKYISKERNSISKWYVYIEDVIKKCADLIGKKNGFDGELLRYMTLNEIRSYLEKSIISQKELKELEKRRNEYLYLYFEEKEYVFIKKSIIKDIKKQFFYLDTEGIKEIKGYVAYPGFVKGVVYNTRNKKHTNKKGDFILVTHMTLPGDTFLISKCLAIVTDEGGMLSHAAVIAREMKKPCIIGTMVATRTLNDGDLVEVDADKGIVRKLR